LHTTVLPWDCLITYNKSTAKISSNKFAMTQEKVTMMYFKAFFCHMHRGTGTDKKERKKEKPVSG